MLVAEGADGVAMTDTDMGWRRLSQLLPSVCVTKMVNVSALVFVKLGGIVDAMPPVA
jgi:hypothetical protein